MSANLIDRSRSRPPQSHKSSPAAESRRLSSEPSLLSPVTESSETRFIAGYVLCMAIVCVSILLLIYASILFAPEYVQIPADAIDR
ncbi:hypothetical protein [Rubinisphaera margarita]|uniref:hypothetical protein n=1 Tax=Rubinisphaera margarita TaxID=2909586 RepID=UPI001EE98F41|nr:hypothetical protein [Rubinisphaera margarita]MCG6158143.1 hypothetical protein [Rubinisphaera margarita]